MTGSALLTVFAAAEPAAALIFGHGAGAGARSPFIVRAARALAARRVTVATFDFPYMAEGRRVPDRPPVLEAAWRAAIDEARGRLGPLPLFIGGKSMGGRIASQVAAQRGAGALAGLVFLGYPLHPPGKPQQRRDAHLPAIAEPMLFVQGSRDAFGTADEIRQLLPGLQRATLYEVEGADHSLKVSARDRTGTGEPIEAALDAAAAWMVQHAG